jgi:hypothetical protein
MPTWALVPFAMSPTYIGLWYAFGSDRRFSSPTFGAAKQMFPMPVWGAVLLTIAFWLWVAIFLHREEAYDARGSITTWRTLLPLDRARGWRCLRRVVGRRRLLPSGPQPRRHPHRHRLARARVLRLHLGGDPGRVGPGRVSSPDVIALGVVGALGGVLVGTGLVGPDVMFTDAGYAMVGVVFSSLIGATATVLVAYITVNASRRSRDAADREDEPDDPPRKSP